MQPPKFWKNPPEQVGIWPSILAPLSCVWSLVTTWRWKQGAHATVGIPVICVGNVNLGGTGKTPTVIATVMRLQALGRVPHVVSKGYKGQLAGPVQVDEKTHSADDVGDEPLLLAAFAPTWVAKDRLSGALAAKAAGADVIVLDDGLQNPALAKDLTILVVDAEVGFGNGRVMPSGPLRETVEDAVAKADVLLTIGPDTDMHSTFVDQWDQVKGLPHVSSTIMPLQTGMDWDGLHALAFAGIGRPEKFFRTLKELGVDIKATRSFDDHQKIPTALLARLEKEAWDLGAQLVTTEKDAVRLPKDWQQKVLTVPVRLELNETDQFDQALKAIF
ncbi:tetraacyldisaccharide 4'-kinase [Amylibacter sp. SFDW26]|uniref:tetraacyldisaccharide 4'-kinase n=1 Tax=Amylibacter sp. SFDW26 TaxID=2652722 RepID=UPI001261EB52|nr:tetraacyldisaccharide 4'-kinase [Amylibacter sp. SFDW26]KAB7614460.1 tetraacyldisaccharide 4'-kinase [Amylibacter sp. SFDW26]